MLVESCKCPGTLEELTFSFENRKRGGEVLLNLLSTPFDPRKIPLTLELVDPESPRSLVQVSINANHRRTFVRDLLTFKPAIDAAC